MKKYLPDFFVGLGVGFFSFVLSIFTILKFGSWQHWLYNAVIFIVLFGGYFIYFRYPNNIKPIPSLLVSLFGFLVTIILWIIIVLSAISNMEIL